MGTTQFTIKDEFKKLIPSHSEIDLQLLEEGILQEGVKHPLTVWKEENILIDGHTRLSICQKHNIPYVIDYKSFSDEDHVISWMIQNQFSSGRNLTNQQISYLRGKKYEAEKRIHGGDRGNQHTNKSNELPSSGFLNLADKNTKQVESGNLIQPTQGGKHTPRTADRIGKEYGVTHETIFQDQRFSRSVDTLAAVVSPEVKNDILSGKVKLSKKMINEIALVADSNPEHAKELYEEAKMKKKEKKPKADKKQESNVVSITQKKEVTLEQPDTKQEETTLENHVSIPAPCPVCGHIDGTKDMFSGGEYEHEQKWTNELRDKKPLTDALQIAVAAIYRIKAIREDDPDKLEAWARVSEWLESAKADHEAGRKQPKLRRR